MSSLLQAGLQPMSLITIRNSRASYCSFRSFWVGYFFSRINRPEGQSGKWRTCLETLTIARIRSYIDNDFPFQLGLNLTLVRRYATGPSGSQGSVDGCLCMDAFKAMNHSQILPLHPLVQLRIRCRSPSKGARYLMEDAWLRKRLSGCLCW